MIPRVFPQWVDEQVIIDIFHKQRLGQVYKVSITRMPDSKRRDYPIYQAIIYFSAWYENEIAYNFQQRIFGPKKQARVVYDDPWFWVVFENTKQRLSNNDKRIMRLGRQAVVHVQKFDELDELEEKVQVLQEQQQVQVQTVADLIKRVKEGQEQHKQWVLEKIQEHRLWLNALRPDIALKKEQWVQQQKEKKAEQKQHILNPNAVSFRSTQLIKEEEELIETATRVAEAALAVDEDDEEMEETATRVAEAALYEDISDNEYDSEYSACGSPQCQMMQERMWLQRCAKNNEKYDYSKW